MGVLARVPVTAANWGVSVKFHLGVAAAIGGELFRRLEFQRTRARGMKGYGMAGEREGEKYPLEIRKELGVLM